MAQYQQAHIIENQQKLIEKFLSNETKEKNTGLVNQRKLIILFYFNKRNTFKVRNNVGIYLKK